MRLLAGFSFLQALGLRVPHWLLAGGIPSVPFHMVFSIMHLTDLQQLPQSKQVGERVPKRKQHGLISKLISITFGAFSSLEESH